MGRIVMFYSLGMNELDSRILAFEARLARAPRTVGAKEAAIRAEFDLSPVRYHQRLNAVLDDPEALAAEPLVVKRLRRVRDERESIRRAARGDDPNRN